MEFIIRRCKLCDAFALHILNKNEMGYDYPEEKTENNLKTALEKDHEVIFVAESEGRIVGYIHASVYELLFSDKGVNILGIAVSSEHIRKGIGRALVSVVEEWAISCGASYIRLVSGESRQNAHLFYEKCGFTSNKMQKNFKKRLYIH